MIADGARWVLIRRSEKYISSLNKTKGKLKPLHAMLVAGSSRRNRCGGQREVGAVTGHLPNSSWCRPPVDFRQYGLSSVVDPRCPVC
jgi:hypothetical protein